MPRAGRTAQRQRNRADRPHVGGHVLAVAAVAARRAAHEAAVLVGERDAQPVDLELRDVRDRLVAGTRALPHPLVERAELLDVVGVVEAEHRDEVVDLVEAVDRAAGDALRRRIGGDQLGMIRFEPLELVQQRVELLVRDLGVVVDVVALFVVPNQIAEFAQADVARFRRSIGVEGVQTGLA